MLAKKTTWSVAVVLVIVGMLLIGQSVSRSGQQGQRGQRGQGGGGFDPARMRQMKEQYMQRMLGATDTKWKVLGPRVMKVEELSRQVGGGGLGIMTGSMSSAGPARAGGGLGGRPGGRGPGGMNQKLTEVEKAQKELQTTLDNTAATSDAIRKQLTTLRAAKAKVKQELAKAQRDLLQVVSPRQEAILVLMGMLD